VAPRRPAPDSAAPLALLTTTVTVTVTITVTVTVTVTVTATATATGRDDAPVGFEGASPDRRA
jgi:hypothetical protein